MRIFITTFGLLSACENISKETPGSVDTGSSTNSDTESFEPGCFIVDNGDGYALLNDAITVASDGSVITMDTCGSLHEETVNIDKSVTITGPGSDSFTLTPPTNENAINITAANVTVSGIGINSTRSGISLEGAQGAILDDIVVRASGNWGVKSVASDVSISNSEFSGNGFGGINSDASQFDILDTDVSGNTSYGIYAISGSTIDVQSSTIQGNLSSGSTATQDGIGIYVEGNTILMVNESDIDTNDIFSTYSVNSSVFLSSVNAGETQFGGIWSEGTGELSLIDVSLTNAPTYGIIAQITGAVNIENTNVTTDSTISPSIDAETWRDEGFQSTGLFTNSPVITASDLNISGYNNCGAYFTTSETDAQLSIDGLEITQVGRLGTYVIGYDGSINNLTVDEVYDLDGASDPELNTVCSYVDRYVGAVIVDSIDLTNINLSNIEGYGLTGIQANLLIDGIVTHNNECASVIAFQSAMFLSNGQFSFPNAKQYNLGASVVSYDASTVSIDQSTFEGLSYTESQYDYQIYSYNTSDFQVSNTTFTNGYYGLFSEGSQVTMEDTSFTNIGNMSLYFSQSSTSNHTIERTDFIGGDDTIGYSMYCYDGGQIEINESIFQNIPSDATYLNLCSTELDTVTFTNIGGSALNIYDGDHEWDKLNFDSVGIDNFASGAIELRALSGPTLLSLSSSTLSNVGYDGVYLYSYGTSSPITAYIDGLTVNTSLDDGIYSYGADVLVSNSNFVETGGEALTFNGGTSSVSNSVITDSNSHGVSCNDSTIDLTATTILNAAASGLDATYCNITATGVDIGPVGSNGLNLSYSPFTGGNVNITSTGGSGIYTLDGAVSLINSTIQAALGSGVSATGTNVAINLDQNTIETSGTSGIILNGTTGSITGTTINNSQQYGVQCTNSDTTFCGNNTLLGNLLGEQTGCDLSCGVEANPVLDPPVDTGLPADDTGDPTDTAGTADTAEPPPPVDSGL